MEHTYKTDLIQFCKLIEVWTTWNCGDLAHKINIKLSYTELPKIELRTDILSEGWDIT